jgi:hypothetical protein
MLAAFSVNERLNLRYDGRMTVPFLGNLWAMSQIEVWSVTVDIISYR